LSPRLFTLFLAALPLAAQTSSLQGVITDAQAAIEQQKMAAITEIKNQVGTLVVEVAEKVLRRELSNKSEQENYIRQLSNEVKLN